MIKLVLWLARRTVRIAYMWWLQLCVRTSSSVFKRSFGKFQKLAEEIREERRKFEKDGHA